MSIAENEGEVDASRARASSDSNRSPPTKRSRQSNKQLHEPKSLIDDSTFLPQQMTAARALPLLICSVGNPGSTYANTLHSAGHTVLSRLASHLGASIFQKDRAAGNGLVSKISGADWTLWQSTSYMNESGKGVRTAYMNWVKTLPDGQGRLVIVHDELEKPLGVVTVKTAQGLSPKGHNGLKSIMSLIGQTPFVRLGIGIGRPVSREPSDVANYVLKRMTPAEKAKIEGCVEDVIAKLRLLEKG
nr:peptidyl-trna hydrolase [Quercus suber]